MIIPKRYDHTIEKFNKPNQENVILSVLDYLNK